MTSTLPLAKAKKKTSLLWQALKLLKLCKVGDIVNKFYLFFTLLSIVLISGLISCSSKDSGPNKLKPVSKAAPPFVIKVDPKDQERFKQIQNAPISERAKEQIMFLQSKGHDINWFYGKDEEKVVFHKTVQVIYFNYSNSVISWCSGAFVSNNHISTAGHCNTDTYFGENFDTYISEKSVITEESQSIDCRGQVLFAYKPRYNSPVSYYSCDKLKVQLFQDDEEKIKGEDADSRRAHLYYWDLKDYALFSVNEISSNGNNTVLNTEFDNTKLVINNYRTPLAKSGFEKWQTLAIAVDPPSSYSNQYTATYDLIIGELNHEDSFFDGWTMSPSTLYVKSLKNFTEGGNSGSPVYTKWTNNEELLHLTSNLEDDDWVYISPLYGHRYIGYKKAMVYTHPKLFLDTYLKIMGKN